MHRLLGQHSLVYAVEVEKNAKMPAAETIKRTFNEAGYAAEIFTQAEPEFPDGFIIFIAVPALQGIHIMIWPFVSDITPEIGATLPKRVPCKREDFID